MRPSLLSALGAALLTATPCVAGAELLYDNGAPDRTNGLEMTQFIEADDFELTNPTRLDRLTFWTAERAGAFGGSFTWQIFANSDSNSPGALVLSGTSNNLSRNETGAIVLGGYPEYVNTFDFGQAVLRPGIYWVAVHNGPLTNFTPALSAFWEATSSVGERSSHGAVSPFYQPWFSNQYPGFPSDLAFFVDGVVLPRITDVNFSGGTARISFTTTAGEQYRIEYTNSLSAPAWAALPGAETLPGTGGIVQINDPQPNVRNLPARFYRVVLL